MNHAVRPLKGLCGALYLSIFGTPLLAQTNPDEIVVTGERETERAVDGFVRDIGEETAEGQLARWEGAVCPHVTGLRDEHNGYIAGTITTVAEAVGAEVGEAGCNVNLVVIINADPNTLISEMRNQQPLLFDSLNPPERRSLAEGIEPVRLWSVVSTRGSDGRVAQRQDGATGGLGPGAGLGNADTLYLFGVLPSRILRSTRIDLGATFIVLDAARIEGLNLQQISGFVSMLALAQLDTREPVSPGRSILNLFHNADAPPDDLTPWDIAYLRALYATDNRRSASSQRGQMARMMREDLAADEE